MLEYNGQGQEVYPLYEFAIEIVGAEALEIALDEFAGRIWHLDSSTICAWATLRASSLLPISQLDPF